MILGILNQQKVWFDDDWDYRIQITADATKVGTGGVTGFAAFFDLSAIPSGSAFWTHVAADGADIRVTKADGTTEVPREVVAISTAGHTGELHFRGDLSDTTDTSYWLYYGNAAATEPAAAAANGKYAVWSDSLATWHLTGLADSAVGQNTLTGTVTHVAGKIGNALHVDGTNYATGSDILDLHDATCMTVAFWARRHVLNINETFVDKWQYVGNGTFAIQGGAVSGSGLTVYVATSVGDDGSGCRVDSGAGVFAEDEWKRIAVVYDGSLTGDANRLKVYADGAPVSMTTAAGAVPAALTSGTAPIVLGAFVGLPRVLNGEVDEVSIFDCAQTQAWVDTDFENQNSAATFWKTIGAEEAR